MIIECIIVVILIYELISIFNKLFYLCFYLL